MHILAIKHIAIEGLGLFETFFKNAGALITTVDLSAGDPLPAKPDDFQAVVSLGGPMNVYEEEKYPFLKDENLFIQNILKKDIPFLGICLGSQLLAKAAGAPVKKAPFPEIGICDIWLTQDGQEDLLFTKVKTPFKVFQWHEDMFGIPLSGSCLAGSALCPYQVCRVGKKAYGLQFHVEVTREMVASWIKAYWKIDNVFDNEKSKKMVEEYDQEQKQLYNTATQIFTNFISLIK